MRVFEVTFEYETRDTELTKGNMLIPASNLTDAQQVAMLVLGTSEEILRYQNLTIVEVKRGQSA